MVLIFTKTIAYYFKNQLSHYWLKCHKYYLLQMNDYNDMNLKIYHRLKEIWLLIIGYEYHKSDHWILTKIYLIVDYRLERQTSVYLFID